MNTPPNRVTYREGQRLRTADLTAEQDYLVELEYRHNTTLHSEGIVLGLDAQPGWTAALDRQPGVAVDGEGRALLLDEPRAIAAPAAGKCIDSWLVYCEAPRRIRHGGFSPCGADAFDRWFEFVQVVDTPVDTATDQPVAPVAGAVYLGRTVCSSPPDITYTSLAGAQAAGPREDMVMLVGPETGRDRDGFSVRATGAANPRLAIDRLGVTRWNGTVTLSDYRACARVDLPNHQALIVQAREPGGAGQKMHIRIHPDHVGQVKSVRIDFFSGTEKLGNRIVLSEGSDPATVIKGFPNDRITLTLEKTIESLPTPATTQPAPGGGSPAPVTAPALFDTDADISLNPCGGMLYLKDWPPPLNTNPQPRRGCLPVQPSDDAVREPNGLSFEAMPATPKAPPLPGAYSVQTGNAAQPAQQFRLDLGEKRDNDQTVRLSVGNRDAKLSPYREWLHMTGVCTMSIAGPVADQNNPPINVRVSGNIERAPIKPDPADPNFTTLLVQAWLAGLQRSVQASTVVDLVFNPAPPALIETGKPWSYKVVVTNHSLKEATADGVLEIQTVAGQPSPPQKNISGQVTIPVGQQASFNVTHDPNDTPAGSLTVEVRVFGKIGNSHWWRSQTTGPIPVVQRPSIDLSDFPDSVPPGASWQQGFVIRNGASIALTLNAVTLTEGAGAAQALPGTPVAVPPGGTQAFGPFPHAGIAADLRFDVNAAFAWAGGVISSIENHKTVHVTRDLREKIDAPAHLAVGAAWTFDLRLTNQSTETVTLRALQHRINSADFAAPTAQITITLPVDASIDPGDHITFPGVIGTPIPSLPLPSHKVHLEIDMEYDRGAVPFHPDIVTKEIDVP